MLNRKSLKPGMRICNLVSGEIAIVRADPENPQKIRECHPHYVWVERRVPKGKKIYPIWRFQNCSLVDD